MGYEGVIQGFLTFAVFLCGGLHQRHSRFWLVVHPTLPPA